MKAETGIEADTLTALHTHVTFKNEHVYVIHVARALDGVAPRPSRELTQFKWMRDFANDFNTETKEAVHRRVLDDEFLTAVNATHGNIARGADAARRAVHAHATPTPTTAPHQLPHPGQPNARQEKRHTNTPTQTHPTSGSPTARRNNSDDAVTEYLNYVAATAKRAPDRSKANANDARPDTSASRRTKMPRIHHPYQQPTNQTTAAHLPHTQQQPQKRRTTPERQQRRDTTCSSATRRRRPATTNTSTTAPTSTTTSSPTHPRTPRRTQVRQRSTGVDRRHRAPRHRERPATIRHAGVTSTTAPLRSTHDDSTPQRRPSRAMPGRSTEIPASTTDEPDRNHQPHTSTRPQSRRRCPPNT